MKNRLCRFLETWDLFPIAVIAVALAALMPWIRLHRDFPNEPPEVSLIYRDPTGDIEYFPLIGQLARGTLTDHTIKETAGQRFRSFPHATLLPHAVGWEVFGPRGFIVADVVCALGYFILLTSILRTLRISRTTSTIAAILITMRPLLGYLATRDHPWAMRIPRPFVSEIYALLVLLAALRILASQNPERIARWLALAGALGLLVQGDLHFAMVFALSSPALISAVGLRIGVRATVKNCVIAGVFFVAVISFFLVQRSWEHPDVPIRWGVFNVTRSSAFTGWGRDAAKLIRALAIVGGVTFLMKRREPLASEPDQQVALDRLVPFLLVLLVAGFICQPVSILVLGKTVQTYQFVNRGRILYTLLGLMFGLLCLDGMARRRWPGSRSHLWGRLLALAVVVGFFSDNWFSPPKPYRAPLRNDHYQFTEHVRPSYRECFGELATFLDQAVPQNAVIATFDHQVYTWWTTFRPGYSFLVEPFVSGEPDHELEIRLATFCRHLGMSPTDFTKFVPHSYVNLFWLGLDKYQASSRYTYSHFEDYTAEQKRAIRSSDYSWQIFIPQSELRRLEREFDSLSRDGLASRALDVIVLSNVGPEKPWVPPADQWQQVFENEGFRVFQKR